MAPAAMDFETKGQPTEAGFVPLYPSPATEASSRLPKLDMMPQEILREICSYLVLAHVSLRDNTSVSRRQTFDDYATLRSLCLACKSVSGMASEVLYHNVRLFTCTGTAKLLRTIVENKSRAPRVTHLFSFANPLVCHCGLAGSWSKSDLGVASRTVREVLELLAFANSRAKITLTRFWTRWSAMDHYRVKAEKFCHFVLFAILCHTPRLSFLLGDPRQGPGRADSSVTERVEGLAIANMVPGGAGHGVSPCPPLTTLHLPDMRSIAYLTICAVPSLKDVILGQQITAALQTPCTVRPRLDAQISAINLRSVKSFVVKGYGVLFPPAPHSLMCKLLQSVTQLQVLELVELDATYVGFASGSSMSWRLKDGWNSCLSLLPDTLEGFHWWNSADSRIYYPMTRDLYGQKMRITSLASFPRLRALTLPLRAVFGNMFEEANNSPAPFYLPPSLESLTLRDESAPGKRPADGDHVGYDSPIFDLLRKLACEGSGLLPHLREVTFVYQDQEWGWMGRSHWILVHDLLEKVRTEYRERHIEFKVQPASTSLVRPVCNEDLRSRAQIMAIAGQS